MAKNSKAGRVINVNFEGVTTRDRTPVPEGDYIVKVLDVTQEVSSTDKEMLKWEMEIVDGPCKDRKLFYNTMLQANSLWKLRKTLEALGYEIPDAAMDLNISELRNGVMGVTVEHSEYQGKMRAEIVDTFVLEETEDEEEEAEEEVAPPPPIVTPKKKAKPAPEPEPEEEDEEDDEEEPAPPPPPAKKKKAAAPPPPPVEEEDEDDEDDEEDEEPEPAPAPKRRRK